MNSLTTSRTVGPSEYVGLPSTSAPAPAVPLSTAYDFSADGRLEVKPGDSSFVFPNGKTLGKYIKDNDISTARELGSGMSGSAYLADFGANKYVLKYVTRTDRVPRSNLERELQFLGLVKGKWWAVQLLAAQILPDGKAFLLFPYIPGKELFDIIFDYQNKKPTQLPLGRIKSIFQSVLDGLKELHVLGIIHRDIKPENVWVPDDPTIRPFLLDFGLSGKITESLKTSGTPTYLRRGRVGLTRSPTPNDNFYALGVSAKYIDDFRIPIYEKLMKNGLTTTNDRFTGGKRRTRRRTTRRNGTRRH
jgi:serine/threonine protein kinase